MMNSFNIILRLSIILAPRCLQQQQYAFARNPDVNREKFLFQVEIDHSLQGYDIYADYYYHDDDDEEEEEEEEEKDQTHINTKDVGETPQSKTLVKEYNPSLSQSLTDTVYDQHNYVLDGIEDVRIKPSFLHDTSIEGTKLSSRYEDIHRVVLWYSPYCANSQRFKSKYIQLADDVTKIVHKNTKDDIEFHAISCSAHHWLCKEYEIRGFPLIWVYKYNSNEYQTLEDHTLESLAIMLDLTVDQTSADTRSKIGIDKEILASDGNIEKKDISSANVFHQSNVAKEREKQEPEETVIDILGASIDIHKRTRNDIFHDAAVSFMHSIISMETIKSTSTVNPIDIQHSLKSIFFQSKNEVQGREETLAEYLDLLFWSLPPSWKLLTIISEIRFSLQDYQSSSAASFTEKELIMILSNSVNSHQDFVLEKAPQTWTQSCSQRNTSRRSKYQCGLWNLFHIISIGVTERHKAVLGGRDRVSTEHAALTLKHFVSNFVLFDNENKISSNKHGRKDWNRLLSLLTRDCGTEFDKCNQFRRKRGKESHQYYSDTQHWREFPLWLWEIHNELNVLAYKDEMQERGQDCCTKEQEVTVVFPSSQDCPGCRNLHGDWDKERVYEFLKSQYWPSGIHNFRYVVLDVKDQNIVKRLDSPNQIFSVVKKIIIISCAYLVWKNIKTKRKHFQIIGLQKKSDD